MHLIHVRHLNQRYCGWTIRIPGCGLIIFIHYIQTTSAIGVQIFTSGLIHIL